jgi:hypothetical protein
MNIFLHGYYTKYRILIAVLIFVFYYFIIVTSANAQSNAPYNCTATAYGMNCQPINPSWVPPEKPVATGRRNRCSSDEFREMGRALGSPYAYPGETAERLNIVRKWRAECDSVEESARLQKQQELQRAADEARDKEALRIQQQNSEADRVRAEKLMDQQGLEKKQQESDRQEELQLRTQVSSAILEGRCDDAKKAALLRGRIDMAEQAMRLCKPKPVRASLKSTGKAADQDRESKPTAKVFVTARQPTPSPVSSVPSIRDTPPAATPAPAHQIIATHDFIRPSAEQIEENKKLYVRRRVVELVSQGYCESAVQMASSVGEPELVKPSSACGSAVTKPPAVSKTILQKNLTTDQQFNLGVKYDNGQGVAQNYVVAASWYRKAAEQGDARAQLALGLMYAAGRGVARDDAAAVNWYRKAAAQGNAQAKFYCGPACERNSVTGEFGILSPR